MSTLRIMQQTGECVTVYSKTKCYPSPFEFIQASQDAEVTCCDMVWRNETWAHMPHRKWEVSTVDSQRSSRYRWKGGYDHRRYAGSSNHQDKWEKQSATYGRTTVRSKKFDRRGHTQARENRIREQEAVGAHERWEERTQCAHKVRDEQREQK